MLDETLALPFSRLNLTVSDLKELGTDVQSAG
jgi:hypothetical protein